LRKPKQTRWVVDEDALPRGWLGRPFGELVVEPDGADLVVEREVRVVAAPDELVGHGLDQRAGKRRDVGKTQRLREAVETGEFDVAALRAVVDELEELLKSGLLDAVLRREQPEVGHRELDRQLAQHGHQFAYQPARREEVEVPAEFARYSG